MIPETRLQEIEELASAPYLGVSMVTLDGREVLKLISEVRRLQEDLNAQALLWMKGDHLKDTGNGINIKTGGKNE